MKAALPITLLSVLFSADLSRAVTQVVLLGTGTPNADPDRSGPSTAIVVNGTSYLVDFGPGVVRRAAAAARKGIKGLEAKNLRVAFVTHLHSDHTAGYPDLIFTPAVLERDAPLEVYGPKGIRDMTTHVLAAYREDMRIRFTGGEPAKPRGYVVNVHEVRPGLVYQDQNAKVEAFPVKHGSWELAFGYRFTTPDRTIVISGDTSPGESVVQNCDKCDVLIHEVYSQAGFAELAAIAEKTKPGLLVLTHQLIWSSNAEEMMKEVRAVYQGNVVFGNDLDVY